MYKLYGRPGTGSAAIEAMLALIGAPHEIHDVVRGPDRQPPESLLKLNPLGQVPTLILPSGEVMTESAAMAIHLADLYPAARLAPAANTPKRPIFLRWLIFMATNVYTTDLRLYYAERYSTARDGGEGVKAAALVQMAREWGILAAELGDRKFILGDEFSCADIYAAMLATWNLDVPAFYARHPNVKALYDRVAAEPRIAKVWQRNGMPA